MNNTNQNDQPKAPNSFTRIWEGVVIGLLVSFLCSILIFLWSILMSNDQNYSNIEKDKLSEKRSRMDTLQDLDLDSFMRSNQSKKKDQEKIENLSKVIIENKKITKQSTPNTRIQRNNNVELSVYSLCKSDPYIIVSVDSIVIGKTINLLNEKIPYPVVRSMISVGLHEISATDENGIIIFKQKFEIDYDHSIVNIDYCSKYGIGNGMLCVKTWKPGIFILYINEEPYDFASKYQGTGVFCDQFDRESRFVLPAGHYTVSAKTKDNKWLAKEKEIIINEEECQIIELDWETSKTKKSRPK
jgi:hypothetical protein